MTSYIDEKWHNVERVIFSRRLASAMVKGRDIIYVDETSFQLDANMKTAKTYQCRGQTITMPFHRGRNTTGVNLCMAIGKPLLGGRVYSFIDNLKAESFKDFLDQLVMQLKPDTVLPLLIVLDNAGCHNDTTTLRRFEALGIEVEFLPSSSSPLNSIERLFSKLKFLVTQQVIKTVITKTQMTTEWLQDMVQVAIETLTEADYIALLDANRQDIRNHLNAGVDVVPTDLMKSSAYTVNKKKDRYAYVQEKVPHGIARVLNSDL